MSKLRDELLALFSLKKGKIATANRKSLDRFVDRTEFQKRRQVFFEASCSFGKKKSRVAMCKKSNRPPFAVELKTQTTKQLRKTILEFLRELGLADVPALMKKSEKQLQSLAQKKRWEAVLYLSDNVLDKEPDAEPEVEPEAAPKKGGMFGGRQGVDLTGYQSEEGASDQEPEELEWMKALSPEARQVLDSKREAAQAHQTRRRRRRRSTMVPALARTASVAPLRLRDGGARRRRGPVRGTKYHKKPRVVRGRDEEGALIIEREDNSPAGSEDFQGLSGQPFNDPVQEIPPDEERFAVVHPALVEPVSERAPPILRREQKSKAAVQPKVRTAAPVLPKITQPVKTGQDKRKTEHEAEEEKDTQPELKSSESDDEVRECYAIDAAEDASSCVPDPLSKVRLSKAQRKELNRINALRKLNCAKLNLLKTTLDLQRYQAKVWEADRQNSNGDYLALFGKNPKSKLKKIKDVTSPEGRDFLKAVLANQNATHRLKKGHEHLQKRLANQKGKLGKDFTLASMRYDQVLDEKAWSNDVFTQRALENREIEPPLEGKITCDSYKVPRFPPPPKCPEKKEDKPVVNLSQLPKVVPQKEPRVPEQPVPVQGQPDEAVQEQRREAGGKELCHVTYRNAKFTGLTKFRKLNCSLLYNRSSPLYQPRCLTPA